MGSRPTWPRLLAIVAAAAVAACTGRAPAGNGPTAPWTPAADSWRDDPAWFDGRAEVARYRATATIYDTPREYSATLYTNSEHIDPATGLKVEDRSGVPAFKHHLRERIPTENYDYEFSTTAWVTRERLGSFKLTVSTQEDCGASFKQVTYARGDHDYLESVYYPGPGPRSGRVGGGARLVFEDALTLVLRDLGEGADVELDVLPSQRSTRRVGFAHVRMRARDGGTATLELPIGRVPARRIDLVRADGALHASYWFALERASPWLGALVRYEGPGGRTLALESLARDAYWLREG